MYATTMEELMQLMRKGSIARKYALEHREDLISREHSFEIYGPYGNWLGASIPCNTVTSKKVRKLTHKTRRKDYLLYQLDEEYKVMRTLQVLNNEVVHVYHHFTLDDAVYAYCYDRGLNNEIHFFYYAADGKNIIYGMVCPGIFLFVQFYEYVSNEKMLVSTYRYTPGLKRTVYGCIPDPEAPIGAPNSVVQQYFYEETPEDTDFARWFV